MAHRTLRIDPEVANLDGGLFAGLPQEDLPLSAFRLEGAVFEPAREERTKPPRPRRARVDSMAPMALSPTLTKRAPEARHRASWLPTAMVAFGAACLGVSLMTSASPTRTPNLAPAARVIEAAPVVATPEAAPVVAAPEAAPGVTREAAPVAAAPRAAVAARPQAAANATPAPPAPAPAAPEAAPPASSADLPAWMPEIPPAPKPPEVAFAPAAAAVAIAAAGLRAASCWDAEAGALAVPVSVTFAISGRVTRATLDGGPLLGTPEGSCLARTLRGATVPAFDGEPVTVHTTVHRSASAREP